MNKARSLSSVCISSAVLSLMSVPALAQEQKVEPQPVAKSAELLKVGRSTVLSATFDRKDVRELRTLTINPEGRAFVLRDDGTGFDREAGDGVFAGEVDANFESEQRIAESLVANSRNKAAKLVFNGRTPASSASPLRIDTNITATRIPLIGTSFSVDVEQDHSLFITDLNVVEDFDLAIDPCNPPAPSLTDPNPLDSHKWSFGHLMSEMSGPMDARDFTMNMFISWTGDQTINGDVVNERDNILTNVLNVWPRDSDNKLDLLRSPFALKAIVNRIDLRDNPTYGGGGGNAGEGRFVFVFVDPNNCSIGRSFTVIFEYGIPITGCNAIKNWGQQWADLSSLILGSPAYNDALKAITCQFTEAGANPDKPNGSAINQVRTNEIFLASPWELREFHLADGLLIPSVTALTPADSHNGLQMLANFINTAYTGPCPDDSPPKAVPFFGDPLDPNFSGTTAFLGGGPNVSFPPSNFVWNAPGIVDTTCRFVMSLNTCNGCHGGETDTFFTHITTVGIGTETTPSGFLTGINVIDDVDGVPHSFNDLLRREIDLQNLIDTSCFGGILTRRAAFTH